MRITHTICGFCLQFADSTYSCRFRDSLSLLSTYTYVIFCSWIPKTYSGIYTFNCRFPKVACFGSNFEQYSVLAICPWNPKQQRRSKKNSNFAEFGTSWTFSCCGICSQFNTYTVWPRNVWYVKAFRYWLSCMHFEQKKPKTANMFFFQ